MIDANVALRACGTEGGFRRFRREPLTAPRLMWSEFLSALRVARWREAISEDRAALSRTRLARSRIRPGDHPDLAEQAWELATELGWAKTYDAEYLALARLLRSRLATLDARLRRAAERLGVEAAAI